MPKDSAKEMEKEGKERRKENEDTAVSCLHSHVLFGAPCCICRNIIINNNESSSIGIMRNEFPRMCSAPPPPASFHLQSSVSNVAFFLDCPIPIPLYLSRHLAILQIHPWRSEDLALSHPALEVFRVILCKIIVRICMGKCFAVQSKGKKESAPQGPSRYWHRNMLSRKVQFHADRLQHFGQIATAYGGLF